MIQLLNSFPINKASEDPGCISPTPNKRPQATETPAVHHPK